MPFTGKFRAMKRRRRKAEPIDLIPVMTGSKKWWQSKTIIGLVVLIINMLAKKFDWLPEGEWEPFIQTIIDAVGAILVGWGRLKADKKIEPIIRKPEIVGLIILGGILAVSLSSCTSTPFEFEDLRAQAVDASGYDPDKPVQLEVGKWTGVAVRVVGLPVGFALVYLGDRTVEERPMKEVGPGMVTVSPSK